MRILSVVIICLCVMLFSVNTSANDEKKKKSEKVNEAVVM
jgi:hypothetical protein